MSVVKLLPQFAACAILIFTTYGAKAQSGAVTVLAVQKALEDTLNKFNSTLNTAGNEVRSSGASLASNAQNVLTDLNSQLGGRLAETLDQLQGAQRQLANDAIEVTRQVNQATLAIVTKSGQEARTTIAEADIVAYNASYSLPCRTLTPRIVYATPDFIRIGSNNTEVHLKGNFLDLGQKPVVAVDNSPAKIIARSRNEIVLELSSIVLSGITDPRSISMSLKLQEARRTNFWLFCWDRLADVSMDAAILIRPQLSYRITGTINGTFQTVTPWSQTFNYKRSDNDCDANYADNQQFCAPEKYRLKAQGFSNLQKVSANCNSSIGDAQIAGERCVLVPAHLGGCGYDNLIVGKNCKGRGFFEYNVTVNAETTAPSNIADFPFELTSRDATQKSFQTAHPDAGKNLPNAVWHYSVLVEVSEGNRKIKAISAGDGNPNPEGVVTRASAGVVYINILE
jgi:hypothetical protein